MKPVAAKKAAGTVTAIRGANVTDCLRDMLKRAEAGEILCVAMVYESTETMGHAVAHERDADLLSVLGGIELLKHSLIRSQEDLDDAGRA